MDNTILSPLKVDLGCGSTKSDGFVGMDRMPMPGVDLIGDLDGTLPFVSDSVDLLFASHSLEHARDIIHTMREVYRICKHGAQVCIVAPYYEQKLNLANPYHLNVFNEHTPRFWTNSRLANADTSQYWHPHAATWGLAESDNSNPGIDFRLARMEFFYFPQFLALSEEERLIARRHYTDVCDQVLFHLVVWKRPSASDEEVLDHIAALDFYDPPLVSARRAKDSALLASTRGGGSELEMLGFGASVRHDVSRNMDKIARLEDRVSSLALGGTESRTELSRNAESIARLEAQLASLKDKLVELQDDKSREMDAQTIAEMRHRLSIAEARMASDATLIVSQQNAIQAMEASLQSVCGETESQSSLLEDAWIDALRLADENARQRSRKVIRLLDRVTDRSDLSPDLNGEYAGVISSADGRIVTGGDLRQCAFLAYRIKLGLTKPGAIEVGFLQTVRNVDDHVGVEIVTPGGEIVWHVSRPLDGSPGPVRFPVDLPTLAADTILEVRVFSNTRIAPIYPLEVVRSRLRKRHDLLARWV